MRTKTVISRLAWLTFSLLLGACLGGGERTEGEDGAMPGATPGNYSALVTWDIPITRVDGEELLLSEIGGYLIEYRISGTEDFTNITVRDPTASQYAIENLHPGQYQIRIAAYDTHGLHSEFSALVSASIGAANGL